MTQKSASEVESKRRIGYLEALSQIQSEIASHRSIEPVIDKVMQAAMGTFGLGDAACAVLLLDPDGKTLTCTACKGILRSEYDKAVTPPPKKKEKKAASTV